MSFTVRAGCRRHPDDDHDRPVERVAILSNAVCGRNASAAHRTAALGEMTRDIVHDFRNILTIIQSGLGMAERFREDPQRIQNYVAAAREGVARGLQLTSRLLAFATRDDTRPGLTDVNELLLNHSLLLKYGAGSGVRVTFAFTPGLPKCLIKPPQFSAALLNLVVNARDAMPDGGEIVIKTALREDEYSASQLPSSYVSVSVSDNGIGMSREVADSIFDPYFTTKGDAGSGLGLPQVCALMERAGGQVSVTSEPGHGTQVELLFPAQQELQRGNLAPETGGPLAE